MLFIQYLKSLYQYNKKIFVLFVSVIFIYTLTFILQIINRSYIELSPFDTWGMYSEVQHPQKNYQVYLITINNNERVDYLNGIYSLNKLLLINPLDYYREMKANGDIDKSRIFMKSKLGSFYTNHQATFDNCTNAKEDYTAFFNWYKRYLSQTIKKQIDSLHIQLLNVSYSSDKKIIVNDTIDLIKF